MSSFKCNKCGYIHNGELLKDFTCPICNEPYTSFDAIQGLSTPKTENTTSNILDYLPEFKRNDSSVRYMSEIHEMAVSGKSIIDAMSTKLPIVNWDDILILGAQLNPPPLNEHDFVNTTTIIGKNAKKPMIIESPVYISHMSFGALSRETKISLSKGAAMAKTAMCSGEGGILPEEMAAAYKYIFEYVPNMYSVTT